MRTLFASFRCILPILDQPSAITHQHSATNALLVQHHQVPGIRHRSLVRITMKRNVMKDAHIRLHLKTDNRPYPYWLFLNQQFHDRLVYIFHQTLSLLLRFRPHWGTKRYEQNAHTPFIKLFIISSPPKVLLGHVARMGLLYTRRKRSLTPSTQGCAIHLSGCSRHTSLHQDTVPHYPSRFHHRRKF